MGLFDGIEKFINEHGSAVVLQQQLAFAKDQFEGMERKVSDLQTKVGGLEAQLERERSEHKQAREDLQKLKDEHAEEVRIHRLIQFRRGKRTGGKWMAFCPRCGLPATEGRIMNSLAVYCCSKYEECGWRVNPPMPLTQIIQELDA